MDPVETPAREIDPDEATQGEITGNTLRALNELTPEKPPPELKLEPPEPTQEPEPNENPYRFLAFWQDANSERDFGLKFKPETGPKDFLDAEVERLGLAELVSPAEIKSAAVASLERFRSHYSKRTGRARKGNRPKTRGSQLHPSQLTEELVGWLRTDLARLKARPTFQRDRTSAARAKASKSFKTAIQKFEREEQGGI